MWQRAPEPIDLAEASASELLASPRGRLRLIAPVSFGSEGLIPVLTEFLDCYAEVSVDLTLDNRTPDLIGDGNELASTSAMWMCRTWSRGPCAPTDAFWRQPRAILPNKDGPHRQWSYAITHASVYRIGVTKSLASGGAK